MNLLSCDMVTKLIYTPIRTSLFSRFYRSSDSQRGVWNGIRRDKPTSSLLSNRETCGYVAQSFSSCTSSYKSKRDFTKIKMGSNRDSTTICLFDVDGTLTAPRQKITHQMDSFLQQFRQKCHIGLVGGSDLVKIVEQIGESEEEAFQKYDYVFAENGLVAYKGNVLFSKTSIQTELGEEKLQRFLNYTLLALSEIEVPFKRGTFIEFRCGLINVCPVGRNCTQEERDTFEAYDKIHKVRETLVKRLQNKFSDLNLKYSIGGQISFDVFPRGWDKTYCLRHLEADGFTKIYFFGDKTFEGGNDYEIFTHPKTVGHSVKNPDETQAHLQKLFESRL